MFSATGNGRVRVNPGEFALGINRLRSPLGSLSWLNGPRSLILCLFILINPNHHSVDRHSLRTKINKDHSNIYYCVK